MEKEMLALVTFKEGMFDKFMGWFQSEEGLEIRKTIAHVEQTRPGFAPDKSYAMMKVTVHNEENMKQFASGNYPNPNEKLCLMIVLTTSSCGIYLKQKYNL